MKNTILLILSVGLLVAIFGLFHINNKRNDLKDDLKHLNNTIDITVDKAINDAKKRVTDSLLNEFNQHEPITETKIKIQYKYDTIINSVILMPSSEQLEYVTRELSRLYPDK